MVTEEVAKKGRALMYADDLVLICEAKEEARQRLKPGDMRLRVKD